MTLPWHMQQDANGQFCIRPCENAVTLRGQARTIECDRFVSGSPYTVNQAGNCIEIEAEIDLSRARALRISVFASSDGREHTDITVTRRSEDSRNVSFRAVGGDAPVQKFNIWEMQPV